MQAVLGLVGRRRADRVGTQVEQSVERAKRLPLRHRIGLPDRQHNVAGAAGQGGEIGAEAPHIISRGWPYSSRSVGSTAIYLTNIRDLAKV